MKTIILYKDDFKHNCFGFGMSWEGLLEDLGIETHEVVAGRRIDKELEEVTITVVKAEAE